MALSESASSHVSVREFLSALHPPLGGLGAVVRAGVRLSVCLSARRMTERPPSEAARSDPPLEGRDAAEARMAPPHLVLLNGVAKETSRAAPAEPPVIELGARGGPGGGPAGGGGAARDLKGRDAAAAEARHRVPTTELCRPPGPAPAPASAPAELPGDGRMVQLSPPALAAPAAPGRALLYSLSQPLASLGRSGPRREGRAGRAGGHGGSTRPGRPSAPRSDRLPPDGAERRERGSTGGVVNCTPEPVRPRPGLLRGSVRVRVRGPAVGCSVRVRRAWLCGSPGGVRAFGSAGLWLPVSGSGLAVQ